MSLLLVWTSLIGITGVVWALGNAYWRSWRFRKIKNLPPGCMGWPIIGELVQYVTTVRSETPFVFTREKEKKYGSVFKTSLLTGKTIMVTDVESIKFVLQNEGTLFETGYPKSLKTVLGNYGMLFQQGSIHKRINVMFKRLSNSTVLKKHLISKIEIILRNGMSTWPVGERMLLQDKIYRVIHDFLMMQQFGLEPGEISSIIFEEYGIMRAGMVNVPLLLPGTPYFKAMKARARVSKVIREMIASRRARKEKEESKDILDAMLEEIPTEEFDSDQIIIDNSLINLANSEGVPAIVATVAVKYLSEIPKALDQMREENLAIRNGKDPDEGLTWNEYMSLEFTQAVINETLRLTSIAQGVTRRAIKDIEYRGYTIPKGWTVLPYFLNLHFDEKVFPEPTKFNPWRWLEKNIPSTHIWYFGGGARLCPGQELARMQIMVFLHYFITTYKWDAEPDTMINFPIVTTRKLLPVVLHKL